MDGRYFIVAGVAQKDGDWYALGTFDGRFLQLPISEDEAKDIAPRLSDERTYHWSVEEDRMTRDAELLVAARSTEVVPA